MKRSHDVLKLSDVYTNWIKDNNYEDTTLGLKITENWTEIVGNTISNHTSKVSVKLPILYLKINNSSLKELLYTDKALLIDKINEYMKNKAIEDIRFT